MRHREATTAATMLVLALVVPAGCSSQPPPGPVSGRGAPATSPASRELTLLYTSDEHGWIEPYQSKTQRIGGFTQLLGRLVDDENHCAGALPPAPQPDCESATSVLLSGGDHYTGPAISGHFEGASTAAVIRRLGYASSAFGNHEMDFGPERFASNRTLTSLDYLAANMHQANGAATDWAKPSTIIERAGVTLGVVGMATVHTREQGAAKYFEGVVFDDPAEPIGQAVEQLWSRDVDAVVLLAHECHDVVTELVAAHPEWHLAFAGAGHCHTVHQEMVGDTPVIEPGWRLDHYARVRLRIDKSQPAKERSRLVEATVIEVKSVDDPPDRAVDEALAKQVAAWSSEVKQALGERIGYSAKGLARASDGMARWVLDSWRARFGSDVAITTEGALRQELAPGPITVADVQSILPFANDLVVCQIRGRDLVELVGKPMALASGIARSAEGWTDEDGKPLDPERLYRVATTDFLYHGGDGFDFERLDPRPTLTGINWRVPVIDWTRQAKSDATRPLESLLRRP